MFNEFPFDVGPDLNWLSIRVVATDDLPVTPHQKLLKVPVNIIDGNGVVEQPVMELVVDWRTIFL